MSCEKNIYFSRPYLQSFEIHNNRAISFYYVVIENKGLPVGLAVIQVVNYNFEEDDFENYSNKLAKKLSYHLGCFLKRNYVKILVCGNTFLSGEHGIFISDNENKKEVLEQIVIAIQQLIKSTPDLKNLTDIILIKDFAPDSLPIASRLEKMNFSSVKVDPSMILTLHPHWKDFNDYLNDFRSKFRVKAKKAYKDSSHVIVKSLSAEEILSLQDHLLKLYNNVIANASFNIATLEIKTYYELKKRYPEVFVINSYWLDHKMVGFASGMINKGVLDAHYIGLDYEINKTHAIYSRILYDYVAIGIEKKLKAINFGRTSGEIKSTLGAIPEELTFYLRHRKSITNFFFKPFLRRIKPKPFEQRNPFKKEHAVTV